MQFTLYYAGTLNGRNHSSVLERQQIRRQFHAQVKALWSTSRLEGLGEYLEPRPSYAGDQNPAPAITKRMNGFTFAPLINETFGIAAELEITLLRRAPPGRLLANTDIDNQIKCLLDCLSVPQHENQIPQNDVPNVGEDPFFCLLRDDALVTSLSVRADRLLTEQASPSLNDIVALVVVKTVITSSRQIATMFV